MARSAGAGMQKVSAGLCGAGCCGSTRLLSIVSEARVVEWLPMAAVVVLYYHGADLACNQSDMYVRISTLISFWYLTVLLYVLTVVIISYSKCHSCRRLSQPRPGVSGSVSPGVINSWLLLMIHADYCCQLCMCHARFGARIHTTVGSLASMKTHSSASHASATYRLSVIVPADTLLSAGDPTCHHGSWRHGLVARAGGTEWRSA
jgi:hypothetical protein